MICDCKVLGGESCHMGDGCKAMGTMAREALQQAGNHPAPCTRHCEANAYEIEIRRVSAERDEATRRSRLAERNLLDAQEAGKKMAKQAFDAERERDDLVAKLKDAEHDRDEFRRVMNGFAEKLAELEGQEPVAWIYDWQAPEGLIRDWSTNNAAEIPKRATHIRPLFARQVPAEMSPEFTDTARSALLWVLWHHQGGSSPVGQPIRYALGMDAHEHLSANRVQEAKRWAALAKAESNDFRRGVPQYAQGCNESDELTKAELEIKRLSSKLADMEGQADNLLSTCHRLALELECLLLDTKDLAPVSRWWDSAMVALDEWHKAKDSVSACPVPAEPVNARLLSALIQCRDRFVFYVGHHLDKGDMGKAAENEKFVALANEAISAAEAQQDRLLQDMHDAGREIDRVMAEATPKAARLTDEEIASLLAASDKNSPRVPSFFMTEPHKFARVIETAAIRKNGLAMED